MALKDWKKVATYGSPVIREDYENFKTRDHFILELINKKVGWIVYKGHYPRIVMKTKDGYKRTALKFAKEYMRTH